MSPYRYACEHTKIATHHMPIHMVFIHIYMHMFCNIKKLDEFQQAM